MGRKSPGQSCRSPSKTDPVFWRISPLNFCDKFSKGLFKNNHFSICGIWIFCYEGGQEEWQHDGFTGGCTLGMSQPRSLRLQSGHDSNADKIKHTCRTVHAHRHEALRRLPGWCTSARKRVRVFYDPTDRDLADFRPLCQPDQRGLHRHLQLQGL